LVTYRELLQRREEYPSLFQKTGVFSLLLKPSKINVLSHRASGRYEKQEASRNQMLENGFRLMKKIGAKGMTVSAITKACGIARATFYTFFESKEEFVYHILLYQRNIAKQKYEELFEKNGPLGREKVAEYFHFAESDNVNFYQSLNETDISYIMAKWPHIYSFNPDSDKQICLWMLQRMDNPSSDCNWKIFANLLKNIAILNMSGDLIHRDVYIETKNVLIDGILDYLFGKDAK